MIEITEITRDFLKTIHPRVYFSLKSNNAKYPFITFEINDVTPHSESLDFYSIDVDVWDLPLNNDDLPVDNLNKQINGNGDIVSPTGLNRKTLNNESATVTYALDRTIPLDEEGTGIKRRKNVYHARLFERGN
ncbi:hypothetical protein [Bacillus sp. 2205SS5-2]|uniref:hypothetical protein n=1 Tax=Bacillus sp. 2205SS5-2 TaxID=3109031 RepID=UPI003007D437